MTDDLGHVLKAYEDSLEELHVAVDPIEAIRGALFDGFEDWERQLTFKLAPHLAGEGCLIAAVVGGTNTGKSTVFNALLGRDLSPVSDYAAHTRRPVVAANRMRYAQCLEGGRLLSEAFVPKPRDAELGLGVPREKPMAMPGIAEPQLGSGQDPMAVPGIAEPQLGSGQDPMAVLVVCDDALPDRLVLLDTPDIDSIVQENWELAKNIREAGDVLIAVLTDQKYGDQCVVEFLREAERAGRQVVAVMNKADDGATDYEVTRRQLAQFWNHLRGDAPPAQRRTAIVGGELFPTAGLRPPPAHSADPPEFVMPRFARSAGPDAPPPPVSLDTDETLMAYLEGLDATVVKRGVLAANLAKFTEQANGFFAQADHVGAALHACIAFVETRAAEACAAYSPRPSRETVTVVYDFIQEHATWPDKMLGKATVAVFKAPGWTLKRLREAIAGKFEGGLLESDFNKEQESDLKRIATGLYREYVEAASGSLRDPVAGVGAYVEDALKRLEPGPVADQIVADTLSTDTYIEAYRAYAFQELEQRWTERAFRWKVRFFYDLGLLGSWAGVLVLLSVAGWAPGLAISEIFASLGVPFFHHTVTHAAAYLWGDKLSGLVGKWQSLQREALGRAMRTHLAHPALGGLPDAARSLDENVSQMKELNEQCRNAR